jgi:hypothetical protein
MNFGKEAYLIYPIYVCKAYHLMNKINKQIINKT